MNSYNVIPNKGIENIELGMSKVEIDTLFHGKCIEEEQIEKLLFKGEEKTNLVFVRYDNSRFTVLYDSNKIAIEISATIPFFEEEFLMLYDMNLLQTPAEDVILELSKEASYTYDGDDKDLSTTYIFEELGITLWRESGFHSKLLTDNEFLSMSKEEQEDEKQFMFFASISLY